jgi:hypothetical protein
MIAAKRMTISVRFITMCILFQFCGVLKIAAKVQQIFYICNRENEFIPAKKCSLEPKCKNMSS